MTNEEKYKTPEERSAKFNEFCKRFPRCEHCQTKEHSKDVTIRCYFAWLALEAEEKKEPMRCPFCGGVSVSSRRWISGFYYVQCVDCGSMTKNCYTKDEAVAAWNRRVNND